MDELGDVSVQEKLFMNLWNKCLKSSEFIADSIIPDKCREFILTQHGQLLQHDLRKHLLLHLFNLWDNSILSSGTILSLMDLYDDMTSKKNSHRRNISGGSSISTDGEEKKLTE